MGTTKQIKSDKKTEISAHKESNESKESKITQKQLSQTAKEFMGRNIDDFDNEIELQPQGNTF